MIRTGQTTIITSGVAQPLDEYEGAVNESVLIRADPDNVGEVCIGDDRVSMTVGFVLDPKEAVYFSYGGDLGAVYIVGYNVGDKVSWISCGNI